MRLKSGVKAQPFFHRRLHPVVWHCLGAKKNILMLNWFCCFEFLYTSPEGPSPAAWLSSCFRDPANWECQFLLLPFNGCPHAHKCRFWAETVLIWAHNYFCIFLLKSGFEYWHFYLLFHGDRGVLGADGRSMAIVITQWKQWWYCSSWCRRYRLWWYWCLGDVSLVWY